MPGYHVETGLESAVFIVLLFSGGWVLYCAPPSFLFSLSTLVPHFLRQKETRKIFYALGPPTPILEKNKAQKILSSSTLT